MKKGIDRATLVSMFGIGISLLSLIVIFSQNTVFSFLTTIIVRPFGFIGFWILLPFLFILGLYMLLKQKLVKFKVGLSLWGLLIIIFSLLMLASVWSAPTLVPDVELNFGNVSPTFVEAITALDNNPYVTSSGGGIAGYFLAACLNSAITPIGTQVVCWLLVVIGLCLVFHNQLRKLFNYIKKSKNSSSKARSKDALEADFYGGTSLEEIQEDEPQPTPIINPTPIPVARDSFDNTLEARNFNNTHSLKKAQFTFGEEEDAMLESASFSQSNSPFTSPSFEDEGFSQPMFGSNPVNEEPSYEDYGSDIMPSYEDEVQTLNEPAPSFGAPEANPTPMAAPVIQETQPQPQPVVEEAPVDKLHRPQPKANPVKNYMYPSVDLLDYHEASDDAEKNKASTEDTINRINEIFENLSIGAQVVGATVGPCVTRYDVKTNSNVSINNVARYVEDISIRLGGVSTRFEKIVYGKPTSGLEIPNAVRTNVGLRESIEKLPPISPKTLLYIPFGKNIAGELLAANLAEFPHMLVSGTTGSGKTIFMHSVILSLIMRNKPDELKIVLIDPKKVEMAYYEKIPHLLCPNISQSQKAYVCMKKLVDEMERRYNLFADNRVRDIKGFNEFAKQKGIQPLPYIVVFIDEYADLVEEVKDIKTPVVRIAQKARAAGIHLVIATQRPSVNVIDGVIKANVATRVALMVASQVDSISIINQAGAESLLGNGDMIVDCPLLSKSLKPRVQGCFVDVPELNRVCDFLRDKYPEQYDPEFLDLEERDETPNVEDAPDVGVIDKEMAEEQLYELIKDQIVERDYCSISYIQRTYGVGFPKAGRLFNKLIQDGYVARGGDARGSKVLIKTRSEEQQMGTIEQSTYIPDVEE